MLLLLLFIVSLSNHTFSFFFFPFFCSLSKISIFIYNFLFFNSKNLSFSPVYFYQFLSFFFPFQTHCNRYHFFSGSLSIFCVYLHIFSLFSIKYLSFLRTISTTFSLPFYNIYSLSKVIFLYNSPSYFPPSLIFFLFLFLPSLLFLPFSLIFHCIFYFWALCLSKSNRRSCTLGNHICDSVYQGDSKVSLISGKPWKVRSFKKDKKFMP